MIKLYLKIFALLLMFLAVNSHAQDIGSCDGFVSDDSDKLPLTSEKGTTHNVIKKNSKNKATKSKSSYLSSFKLLIPHSATD